MIHMLISLKCSLSSQVELRASNSFSLLYRNKLAAAMRAILEVHHGLREDEADAMEKALQEPVVKSEGLEELKALLGEEAAKFGIVIEASKERCE